MKKMMQFFTVLGAIMFCTVSYGQESKKEAKTGKTVAHNVTVSAEKEKLGRFLVDGKGMTLYYFTKDSKGTSICKDACIEKWPLFYIEKVKVGGKELKAGEFGVITREDGKKQTTYKGFPLYYFFKDVNPGDTNGQGVNNVWYVIDPSKFNP